MAKLKPFKSGPVTARSMPFWCVGNPLSDPFGGPVLQKITPVQVCKIICDAAADGLIERTGFHDDDLVLWNPDMPEDDLDSGSPAAATIEGIRSMLRKAGLAVNTATCSLHGNPLFRNGGLANPDPAIRDLARLKVERSIRIGAMLGAEFFTYWVARDGFEVPVKVPWKQVHAWLADGLNHAGEYIRACNFANYKGCTIEPKPNEPRGHMYLPTSGHAAAFILGRLKDPGFWGVNPELLQHESMALMNALNALSLLVSVGKLSFLHFGNQIKAQFDNDFPPLVGPEGLRETVQMFWLLDELGWKGTVEFDCHMLRCEGDLDDPIGCRKQFVENCSYALTIALELAARLKGAWSAKLAESRADLVGTARMCGLDFDSIVNKARKR